MTLVRLSHRLLDEQPNWPDAPGITKRPLHRMDDGDIANTHVVEFYTHIGTHCDLPWHFLPGGATMSDVDVGDFVFSSPVVVDISLGDGDLLTAEMLRPHHARLAGADLVLLRSGFERFRGDLARYSRRSPGFAADAAVYLRHINPGLRGVAMDWLSVCALDRADEGVTAHQVLLETRKDRFVIIFEDVSLAPLGTHTPTRVIALPLFVDGLDGSPCTIISEVS